MRPCSMPAGSAGLSALETASWNTADGLAAQDSPEAQVELVRDAVQGSAHRAASSSAAGEAAVPEHPFHRPQLRPS